VDTLRDYKKNFGRGIFLSHRRDNAAKLNEWREPAELAKLAEFVACRDRAVRRRFSRRHFGGRMLKGFPFDVSSSQIRARVKAGWPIEHLVPPFVPTRFTRPALRLNFLRVHPRPSVVKLPPCYRTTN